MANVFIKGYTRSDAYRPIATTERMEAEREYERTYSDAIANDDTFVTRQRERFASAIRRMATTYWNGVTWTVRGVA